MFRRSLDDGQLATEQLPRSAVPPLTQLSRTRQNRQRLGDPKARRAEEAHREIASNLPKLVTGDAALRRYLRRNDPQRQHRLRHPGGRRGRDSRRQSRLLDWPDNRLPPVVALRPAYPFGPGPAEPSAVPIPAPRWENRVLRALRRRPTCLRRLPCGRQSHAMGPFSILYNAGGGALWAVLYGLGGYLFGQAAQRVAGPVGMALLALGLVALGFAWTVFRRQEKRLEAEAERALPRSRNANRWSIPRSRAE
ncbi:MAG: DedA family protein [Rhodospirillales bacterium]|nr:DedA family protein [Rhodospirillales bacterium]